MAQFGEKPVDPEAHAIPPTYPADDAHFGPPDGRLDAEKEGGATAKSPGVARIEAVSSSFTLTSKIILFAGIFLVAYCYGLGASPCFLGGTTSER